MGHRFPHSRHSYIVSCWPQIRRLFIDKEQARLKTRGQSHLDRSQEENENNDCGDKTSAFWVGVTRCCEEGIASWRHQQTCVLFHALDNKDNDVGVKDVVPNATRFLSTTQAQIREHVSDLLNSTRTLQKNYKLLSGFVFWSFLPM